VIVRAELFIIEIPENMKLHLLQTDTPDAPLDSPDPIRDQTKDPIMKLMAPPYTCKNMMNQNTPCGRFNSNNNHGETQ
jgi:hypothetical protein